MMKDNALKKCRKMFPSICWGTITNVIEIIYLNFGRLIVITLLAFTQSQIEISRSYLRPF